jgi:hypothetical protein
MIKKDEETVQLVNEISELKEILREVSQKLTRIETKVKRGLISAASKTLELPNSQVAVDINKSASLSAEQILQIYEELRLKAKNGKEQEGREKLLTMSATDLNLMCCELGMPPSSKNPSRRKMFELIIGRIKQSLMLSRHIDRQTL